MGGSESSLADKIEVKETVLIDLVHQLEEVKNLIEQMVLTVVSSESHGMLDGQNLLRQYQSVFETLGVGLRLLHPSSYIQQLEK